MKISELRKSMMYLDDENDLWKYREGQWMFWSLNLRRWMLPASEQVFADLVPYFRPIDPALIKVLATEYAAPVVPFDPVTVPQVPPVDYGKPPGDILRKVLAPYWAERDEQIKTLTDALDVAKAALADRDNAVRRLTREIKELTGQVSTAQDTRQIETRERIDLSRNVRSALCARDNEGPVGAAKRVYSEVVSLRQKVREIEDHKSARLVAEAGRADALRVLAEVREALGIGVGPNVTTATRDLMTRFAAAESDRDANWRLYEETQRKLDKAEQNLEDRRRAAGGVYDTPPPF